jgi:hypothetical protein
MKMEVIEDWKYLRGPVASWHLLGDLLLSGRVIDMAIGINDFHLNGSPF